MKSGAKHQPGQPADVEARLQTLSQVLATQPPTEPALLEALVQDYNPLLAKHQAGQPANADSDKKNASNQPAGTQPLAQQSAEKSDHDAGSATSSSSSRRF